MAEVEQGAAAPPSRGRGAAAVACLVIAALLTTPAALAFWAQRTVNDGQRYVQTVAPLVDSPEVQAAVAAKVTTAIQSQVNVEEVLNQVFAGVITDRPRLEALVGPMAGAVNGLIESQVRAFIASDAFADAWVAASTRTQQATVRLLEGEPSGAVSLQGDEVVLDVSDVVDQVKARLIARGLTILERAPIPNTDRQIVLLEAPQLEKARTTYAVVNPVAKWLLVVVAALYLAAFALARSRPKMTVAVGVSLALNALLVAFALSVGRQLFIDELSGTDFGLAAASFYDTLLSFLKRGQRVLLLLGLLLVVAGWFAGRNASGRATRSVTSRGLEGVGAAIPAGSGASTSRWVAENVRWLRVVVWGLGAVVLLWGNNVSVSRLVWSAILVVVLLVLLQVVVGNGRPDSPDDRTPPTPPGDATDATLPLGMAPVPPSV
jgi:hypothetical protein